MVGVGDFRQANGPHDLAKLLASDLLGLCAGVLDVQVSEHHATLVARAGDGVLHGNVLAISRFSGLDLRAGDGGVVPALGQWFKVVVTNGQRVNAKFFI